MRRDELGRFVKLTTEEKFWEKVNKTEYCWEWTGCLFPNGYGCLMRYDDDKQYPMLAHRVSWENHFSEIPEGLVVCHKCDNRKCVNPDHLFLGTQKENIQDMIQKNRRVITPSIGSKNGSAKLSEEQVKEIREKFIPRKVTVKMLAEEYGVSAATIEAIVLRKTWKHI